MRTILLTISYDGTDFCGWQKQKPSKTGSVRTVQEELEKALEIIHKEPVVASGSGRTDSGVHASFQAVTFISPIDSIPVEKYIPAINSLLPHDIRVMTAEIKPDGFHARYNATSRSYRYFMWIGETPPAKEMRYIWPLFRKPDIEKLNKMASYLRGEIDCTTFSAAGDKSVSKFRYLEDAHFYLDGEKLVFEIDDAILYYEFIELFGEKTYLSPILDMFNGEILSYGISKIPSAISVLSAQKKAIEITSDCPYRRTFHSDRGWAYQMPAYAYNLKESKIFQSMSRKGNCYDNSVMENFFGLLKQEMYYGNTYYSFDELKEAIEKYIVYYNEKRIKEKLGWMSPVEYRLSALAA